MVDQIDRRSSETWLHHGQHMPGEYGGTVNNTRWHSDNTYDKKIGHNYKDTCQKLMRNHERRRLLPRKLDMDTYLPTVAQWKIDRADLLMRSCPNNTRFFQDVSLATKHTANGVVHVQKQNGERCLTKRKVAKKSGHLKH